MVLSNVIVPSFDLTFTPPRQSMVSDASSAPGDEETADFAIS